MDAAIVIVGDEILSGHVQDANTHFIATRVTSHGHRVLRAAVVSDDPGHIAMEIERCLHSPVSLVFVCGGLGPTHDDRTMEGVAAALGVGLEPCAPLAARIEEAIAHIGRAGFASSFGIEGLRKMALAPVGAEVLPCSVGAIPAVTVAAKQARIFVLPGPPRELQAVFLESVEPGWLAGTGDVVVREEITHPFPESALAATLAEIQTRYPDATIGSYPQPDGVLLRIAGPAVEAHAATDALRARIDELKGSEEGKRLLEFVEAHRRGH